MAPTVAAQTRSLPTAAVRPPDRDAVWRLCGWGGSAIIAVAALAMTVQSDLGQTRIEAFFSEAAPTPTVVAEVPPRPPEPDPETLRLQAEIRSLAADRERLTGRLATLERHLEDVTSSIKQHAAATPAAPPSPPPQVAAVTTTPAPTPAAPTPAIPTIDPLAMPGVTGSIGGWAPATAAAAPAEPAQAAKLETRDVPAAPKAIAALPADEPAPPAQTPSKVEYGIDLGGARDMDALRERWTAIKANLGPLLTGLQPIAVRDQKQGKTENLRLVVGPMPNFAAARQVCARFVASHVACHAAKFNGDAVVQR